VVAVADSACWRRIPRAADSGACRWQDLQGDQTRTANDGSDDFALEAAVRRIGDRGPGTKTQGQQAANRNTGIRQHGVEFIWSAGKFLRAEGKGMTDDLKKDLLAYNALRRGRNWQGHTLNHTDSVFGPVLTPP
jgi:hypothetical protein